MSQVNQSTFLRNFESASTMDFITEMIRATPEEVEQGSEKHIGPPDDSLSSRRARMCAKWARRPPERENSASALDATKYNLVIWDLNKFAEEDLADTTKHKPQEERDQTKAETTKNLESLAAHVKEEKIAKWVSQYLVDLPTNPGTETQSRETEEARSGTSAAEETGSQDVEWALFLHDFE